MSTRDALLSAICELRRELGEIRATMERIEGAVRVRPPPDLQVLSTTEAAGYVGGGLTSQDGFRAWAARWRVRPSGHNRWPLHRIHAGLEREVVQADVARRRGDQR